MFSIQQLSALTGLSRGQVDDMISSYGFKPTDEAIATGNARRFTRADAIRYGLIAALRQVGLPWKLIQEIDTNSGFADFIFGNRPADSGDDYPHEQLLRDQQSVLFVVYFSGEGPGGIREKWQRQLVTDPRGEFLTPDELGDWLKGKSLAPGVVVIDFTAIVARVDRALSGEA